VGGTIGTNIYVCIYIHTDRQPYINQARLDETTSAALKVVSSEHSDAIHTYIHTYVSHTSSKAGTQYICIYVCITYIHTYHTHQARLGRNIYVYTYDTYIHTYHIHTHGRCGRTRHATRDTGHETCDMGQSSPSRSMEQTHLGCRAECVCVCVCVCVLVSSKASHVVMWSRQSQQRSKR